MTKVVVIMPAYNSANTLKKTYETIPKSIVNEIVLVDDCSQDDTISVAREIGIQHIILHDKNKGYGGNQKTCYEKAIDLNADIVVMLHPDYQYEPKLIPAIVAIIESQLFDCVLASRILGNGALKGGMPLMKYLSNRILTFMQNIITGAKLSEYHTGYRAFSSKLLRAIDYHKFSDDFIFDNQFLLEIIKRKYRIAEVTCPTKYFDDASSIGGRKLFKYGLGVIAESIKYIFRKY